jgi:hypothetical protein
LIGRAAIVIFATKSWHFKTMHPLDSVEPGRSSIQFQKHEAGPIGFAIFIQPALVAIDRSNTYQHARHDVGMARHGPRFQLISGENEKMKIL